MSYCRITKQWLPASEMQKVWLDGEEILIAEDCRITVFECRDCGKVFLYYYENEEEGRTTWYYSPKHYNGEPVCEDCLENYTRCNECDELIHLDNDIWYETHEYETICEHCFQEFYAECDNCGRIYPRDEIRWTRDTGIPICDNCSDHYYECRECNALFADSEELEYNEVDDCYYCYRCNSSKTIKNYSYKPEPTFKKFMNINNETEFFGLEIEVEGNTKYAEEFLRICESQNEEDMYLKQDGSVYGFEIVTQPMTRNYFNAVFVPKLTKGMKFLQQMGFHGHNKAGIHIHVSTEAITQDQMKKLVTLLYDKDHYEQWLMITQRHKDKMERWSSMKMSESNIEYFKKTCDERKRAKITGKALCGNCGSRYTAINTHNMETVEFRIFNSNTRIERIVKNFQVICSLLDFTKSTRPATFENYMLYIDNNRKKYPELVDFIEEKHIYQTKRLKRIADGIINKAKQIDSRIDNLASLHRLASSLNEFTSTKIDDNDERTETCV